MSDGKQRLPTVRVVKEAAVADPLRARMHAVLEPSRERGTRALGFVFGMWPLFAVCGLMIGLAWCFAMFQSP